MHKTSTAHATERSIQACRRVSRLPDRHRVWANSPPCLETSLTRRAMQRASAAAGATVVLVDQDNCRASAGWPPAKAFRERLNRLYALDPRHANTAMVIAVDERRHSGKADGGTAPRVRARQLGPRVVVAYSGPRHRADDLIARDCEWWGARPDVAELLIVSSDKLVRRRCNEVKRRCGEARRQACGGQDVRLRFETGEAFVLLLPPEREAGAAVLAESHPTPTDPAATTMDNAAPERSAGASGTEELTSRQAGGGIGGAIVEYVAWIESEQPGPQKSAADVALAGEMSRRGSKRKLGVRR